MLELLLTKRNHNILDNRLSSKKGGGRRAGITLWRAACGEVGKHEHLESGEGQSCADTSLVILARALRPQGAGRYASLAGSPQPGTSLALSPWHASALSGGPAFRPGERVRHHHTPKSDVVVRVVWVVVVPVSRTCVVGVVVPRAATQAPLARPSSGGVARPKLDEWFTSLWIPLQPAPEQPADLDDGPRSVLVLARAQEFQLVGEAKVQPDFLELDIRFHENLSVWPDLARSDQKLMEGQRRIVQPLRENEALALRELERLRDQPDQEIVGLDEDRRVSHERPRQNGIPASTARRRR